MDGSSEVGRGVERGLRSALTFLCVIGMAMSAYADDSELKPVADSPDAAEEQNDSENFPVGIQKLWDALISGKPILDVNLRWECAKADT